MTAVPPPTGSPSLSHREEEVLDLVAQGRTNAEIADALGLSFATVKAYVSSILTKLDVERREEAAVWWQHHGRPSRPSVFARWLRAVAPVGALKATGIVAGSAAALAVGAGVLALAVTAWPSSQDGAAEQAASEVHTAEDCTLPGEPTEMVNRTVRQVDIDGDGRNDAVAVYAVPSQSRWVLRVDLAGGGGFEQILDVESLPVDYSSPLVPPEHVYPAGGLDLDGEPGDEFVLVQQRGAIEQASIYVADGCGLVPAAFDGVPATFRVAFTQGEVAGIRCRDGGFARFTGPSTDGITYEVGTVPLTLAGGELEEGPATTETMHLAAAFPVLLDCPGLTRDYYGPAAELGGYITQVRPEHHGTIAAGDMTAAEFGDPAGICAEVWFDDLPRDYPQIWFRLAVDGHDVSGDTVLILTHGSGVGGWLCYQTEPRAGRLAPGFHTATITVRDPDALEAPPRQVVTWAFDVTVADGR